MRVTLKKLGRWSGLSAMVVLAISLGVNCFIICTAKDRIFTTLQDLPPCHFELVLGTEPVRPDGSINLHFLNRTDAATKVYLAGKAEKILISGNSNNRGFNEVFEMKNRMLAKNIPESALVLDDNGSRTYESVRHAKEIYHIQKVILITNAFHAPRALYICKHFGIDAVAYCPEKTTFGIWPVRYQVREYFARLKAVFDVFGLTRP